MAKQDDKQPPSFAQSEGVVGALLRHSGDCVKVLDLDGQVLAWNPACEAMYGFEQHDVLGMRLPHVPDEQRLRVVMDLRSVAASEQVMEREVESMRSDGSRLRMNVVLIPVYDDDGNPFAVLSMSREMSYDERFERQRDQFVSLVTKGLSEPLAAIASNVQLLSRPEIAENPARRESVAESVAENAAEASRLVDDLLVVSELQSGNLSLEFDLVDLGEVVTELLMRNPECSDRVVVDLDPALPRLHADRKRISNAVAVLLGNALSCTPANKDVTVSVFGADGEAAVEVTDEGPPLDPVEATHLFERFYDGPEPRASVRGGIGLHMAWAVATAHGGTMRVTERRPRGASFEMRLPIHSLAHGEA